MNFYDSTRAALEGQSSEGLTASLNGYPNTTPEFFRNRFSQPSG
jgi:hypothetical protein